MSVTMEELRQLNEQIHSFELDYSVAIAQYNLVDDLDYSKIMPGSTVEKTYNRVDIMPYAGMKYTLLELPPENLIHVMLSIGDRRYTPDEWPYPFLRIDLGNKKMELDAIDTYAWGENEAADSLTDAMRQVAGRLNYQFSKRPV